MKQSLLLGLSVLFLVLLVASLGLLKGYVREGFIEGVKACDRDNDCPDGYLCNSQTCVKTKQYSWTGY
jgi:hypothetical protein